MCGLRVSEALSLKVDDIDFSLNCLSVRKAKSDIVTEDIGISTHDLTKRSTVTNLLLTNKFLHFNSRPHEEVDSKIAYFIPHFCIYY